MDTRHKNDSEQPFLVAAPYRSTDPVFAQPVLVTQPDTYNEDACVKGCIIGMSLGLCCTIS